MPGYGYTMMGSGWGWLMGAVVLVVIALAVIVVLRVVPRHAGTPAAGSSSTSTGTSGVPQTPRQILDERYARGDMTTEEFHERLQNLGSA